AWEVASGQGEPGADQGRKPAEGEVRRAPAGGTGDEDGSVDDPREDRDRLEGVDVSPVALLPDDSDREADRQERQRDDDRAPGESLEGLQRRQPQTQDVGRAALQPPLLPEVEAGERRRHREPRERGKDEPDVEDEEEVAVVAARARVRAAAD